MISVLATNVVSPLGFTTEENYRAVREGRSELLRYDSWRGVPEPFVASMFSDDQRAELAIDGYTLFESVAIRSVEDAVGRCAVSVASPNTIFILSTTKANVDELGGEKYLSPGDSARKIAQYFGFVNDPIVVCNACISGADAQLLALRLLSNGAYDNAVVCGVDVVTPFVVAGFLSFKSLALAPCRPFDIERTGLNLGEAAATIVFGRKAATEGTWQLCAGAMSNDAYHVSAPSPKGDGSYRAINEVLAGVDTADLALLSVHGTATMFNDQMESKAIERAGLCDVPVSALKGYYGHTLGAAGVLESIITMRALNDGVALGVRGFEEIGVSGKVNLSAVERNVKGEMFLKMISGFGGCNGALLFSQSGKDHRQSNQTTPKATGRVVLTNHEVVVNGRKEPFEATGSALLTEIYKQRVGDYPKFYKMDTLSRLALVATELLVQQQEESSEECSIVLFNSSSSIVADRKHIASIQDEANFYPSPSLFLYTLPNIALGEVAIKHRCIGETSLYILERRNEQTMRLAIESIMAQSNIARMITGWINCDDEDNFEADIQIITK
ncbi:MAG: 3-oxoacyl-ACP synthase [Rikenellaceae bacterium]|nr:3-oxoacyl-ACP synthase [Rikenellaceae bacterium]